MTKLKASAVLLFFLAILTITSTGCTINKPPKEKTFTVMWSIYAGWMPWPYADESGILDKWAKKYNIEIDLKQADYISSIEAYVSGKADGVVMTNMEALNMAATAGVDTSVVILGDYSSGNDAVITRGGLGLCDLKDKSINLVQYSVSHYLLERGFEEKCGGIIKEKDLKLINTSDSDIGSTFITSKKQPAVVTWNPIVLEILSQTQDTTVVFDSSQIPYEILDTLALNTETLNNNPELAKALVGAWYETISLMNTNNPESEKVLESMARRAGTSLELYKKQLKTTMMWYSPQEATDFINDSKLVEIMKKVANFSFDKGLYGQNSKSAEDIGISFPNGTIFGDKNNIKLRYNDMFMRMVLDGKL